MQLDPFHLDELLGLMDDAEKEPKRRDAYWNVRAHFTISNSIKS